MSNYKTIKIRLKSILRLRPNIKLKKMLERITHKSLNKNKPYIDKKIKTTPNINEIKNFVIKGNKLTIHIYAFLRLWLLYKYKNEQSIDTINNDIVSIVARIIINKKSKFKINSKYQSIFDELTLFFVNEYQPLMQTKIDGKHMARLVNSLEEGIVSDINNNIIQNFFGYIRKYIKASFKDEYDEINKDTTNNKYKNLNTFKKQLKKIFNDITSNIITDNIKFTSNEKYHTWIKENHKLILPIDAEQNYTHFLNKHPQKFIKNMIFINEKLENLKMAKLQFFPLRKSVILKHIPIDTYALADMFKIKHKIELFKEFDDNKKHIWNIFFNMNHKVFRSKKYQFDYNINTDGYCASIRMVNKSFINKRDLDNEYAKQKKEDIKIICKNMTNEQKDEFRNKRYKQKQDKLDEVDLQKQIFKDLIKSLYKDISNYKKQKMGIIKNMIFEKYRKRTPFKKLPLSEQKKNIS